jgi:23S rRNA pseudouridine1911/1915/1917 synthase
VGQGHRVSSKLLASRASGWQSGATVPGAVLGIVPPELAQKPLDAVVRALFSLSWNEARDHIRKGKIAVNGATRTELLYRARQGAEISLRMNAPRIRAEYLPEGAVVHVDAHVIVVDKPAGVSTIPYEPGEKGTLDERVRFWLAAHAPREEGAERGVRPTLGIVHRLDKETSGLIVFARSWLAKKSLASQFRAHTVLRRYLAIAHGRVTSRTIRSRLIANRGDGLRGSLRGDGKRSEEGQLAVTHIEALEPLEGATLVACVLETGRTNQIRIHMSEAGHPIVGERVYVRGRTEPLLPAPRLMLHAAKLGFVHPKTEETVSWERAPPEDFEQTLGRLGRGRSSR